MDKIHNLYDLHDFGWMLGLHKDLLLGEGEYHFSGQRNAKIFNSTGVPLQCKKKVKVPGKDRGFL